MIHRDLKPGNILVDDDGEPHVLDFGLAKIAMPGGGYDPTMTGEFMGSLAYASPDQVRGDPEQIDTRTDVYSLGMILYELLTGQHPYPVAGPVQEVIRNITEHQPCKPSTIRPEIDDELDTVLIFWNGPSRRSSVNKSCTVHPPGFWTHASLVSPRHSHPSINTRYRCRPAASQMRGQSNCRAFLIGSWPRTLGLLTTATRQGCEVGSRPRPQHVVPE